MKHLRNLIDRRIKRGGFLWAGLQEYKCPCCGGAIAFDSTIQKMKCPYCDTEFEMDALKGYDAELQDEVNRQHGIGKPQQAVNGEKEKRMVCVLMCVNPVEEKL